MDSGIFTGSTTTRACYILADWTKQLFNSADQIMKPAATDEDSLSAAIEAYLLHLRACGYAENTILCYRGCLKRLADLLQNKDLADVDSDALNRALDLMKSQAGLAETTLNKIRSVYRSFFQWAVNSGRSCCNPTALLVLARAVSFPTIAITGEETERLLQVIKCSMESLAARDELLFATYAFAGIRRAEALRLKSDDFDATFKTICLKRTKAGGCRIHPIPDRLADLFEQYLAAWDDGVNRFIFSADNGASHLSARQAAGRFTHWRKVSAIREKLTVHSFRAGYAGRLYRVSGDIWLVARSMGHKSIATTRRYIENDPADIRMAIELAFPLNQAGIDQQDSL